MAPQPRPVDPDARIPDAVRRAAARADEFYKKPESEPNSEEEGNNAQEQNNTQDSGNGEAASSPDVKVSSQASERARRRQERQRSDQSEPAEGTAERTTEQITEHVPQTHQSPPQQQDESWERKFNAMKGRWENANQQLHNQGQQIQNLQNVIASTQQTQQTQHASQEQTTQREVESTLTQEEREQYGDEFLNVVAKKAHEIVGPLKKELEGKLKQLDQQLGNVGQHVDQAAKQEMLDKLDQQIPTWREINNNPEFVSWLRLPDTYSGAIRHELLTAAFNRNQTARVAAFFNGFLAEEAATAPQGQTRPGNASLGSDQDTQPSRPSLETLAAPGRAKSAAAQAPAEKPIFKRAQIAAFYTDVAAGKWQGREKQKEKLEAQIFEAQQDGRIRN
jgi:hypothetical protein